MATSSVTPNTGTETAAAATAATTATTDNTTSVDRALASWTESGKEGTQPAAAAAGSTTSATATTEASAAAGLPDDLKSILGEDLEEPAAAAAAVADPNAPDPLAALKDNPRVMELVKNESLVKEVMAKSSYLQRPEHIADAVTDAHILWEISDGKTDPTVLLEHMRSNPDVPQERFNGIINTLKGYIEKLTGQPIAAAAAGANLTPEQQRIAALEKRDADRAEADKVQNWNRRVTAARTTVDKRLVDSLKGSWLEGEESHIFDAISRKLAGQEEAIVAAIEKGDFKALEKAAKQVRSDEAKRFHARIERIKKLQISKGATIPKQPAAGAPVSSESGDKPIMDKDERLKYAASLMAGA